MKLLTRAFRSLQDDTFFHDLDNISDDDLRPILPTLVRATIFPNFLIAINQQAIRIRLMSFPEVNRLIDFISIDLKKLSTDLRQYRNNLAEISCSKLEKADPFDKFLIIVGYLLNFDEKSSNFLRFEPFTNDYLLEETFWILCLAIDELPDLVDLGEISEKLLRFDKAMELISLLIVNNPDRLLEIVHVLIDKACSDEDSTITANRITVLNHLIQLDEHLIESVLDKLNHMGSLAELSIKLVCRLDDGDFCTRLLHILCEENNAVCSYLISAGRKSSSICHLNPIRSRIDVILRQVVEKADDRGFILPKDVPIGVELLRLISALRSFASLRFPSDDSLSWLDLVLLKVDSGPAGVQFISTALCTLLATPSLLHGQTGESEQNTETRLLAWLEWLLMAEKPFADSGHSYSELLLLIAIQLRAQRLGELSPLVFIVLGFRAVLPHRLAPRLRTMFSTRLLDDLGLCTRSVAVPPTMNLNNNTVGVCLPIHCLVQLLDAGSFAIHKVPVQIFTCDQRIFRSSVHLRCFLQCLQFYLNASRRRLENRLHSAPVASRPSKKTPMAQAEKEELTKALIAAQEVAVVQMLLELCLLGKDENADSPRLTQTRQLCCAQVHRMFLLEPTLSKLVHFQTYPACLLPVVVQLVPSLHICFDFVPELLAQPDLDKRTFAIRLTAQLCTKYPVATGYSRARLVVDVLSTLTSILPIDQCVQLFQPILSSLDQLARAFPPLAAEIGQLLIQVGSIIRSGLAVYGPNERHSISPEKQLLDSIAKAFGNSLIDTALNRCLR